ncbi:hypothetical protein FRC10_001724 [Ceratobasidium sp. 414]|nr:hypothetical protein FRC10_001724 [Ceratobasidium sp. 414]
MSQQNSENRRTTQSVSRAASTALPQPEIQQTEGEGSSLLEMPGGMTSTTLLHPIPQRLSRAISAGVMATEESPNPDSTILPTKNPTRPLESSFQEVEEMTRVIKGQAAEEIIKSSAPPGTGASGIDANPIQVIAAALQLEDTRKRAGAAQDNAYHAAKEAESAAKGVGGRIKDVNDSITQITTTIREINQGLIGQTRGLKGVEEILTALEQRITDFANEIRETRQASARTPATEPAPPTQGLALTEDEDGWDNLPMRPFTDRHTSFAQESTTKPEGLRRAKPLAQENTGDQKPELFNGKKGKEGEGFLISMEVQFQDYKEGTFNDNQKIQATLMNMSAGDAMNWAQPLLRLSAAQENHEFLELWNSFKKGFLTHFSDPAKKEKAVRELSKLTQTTSAQNYTVAFRMLAQEVDWNEQALKDQYMEGLKPQVKTELMRLQIFGEPENVTLEQWITLACKADNMIYANSKMNSNKAPVHSLPKGKGGTTLKTHYKGKEATMMNKTVLVLNEEKDQ